MKKGIIQQSLSGFYDVLDDTEHTIYRTRARGNFRAKKIKPMVGDHVDFQSDNQREGYLLKVHERENQLVRPPIANVDIAVVVTAIKEPEFSSNLLDRQLVALEAQNVTPIIYFSKTDLLDPSAASTFNETIVTGYRTIGYHVIFHQPAFNEQVKTELLSLLTGKISVVMGQTGAGKSTLLNQLSPELQLATGEISQALQRGKHTTRKVSLLNINGSLIADTPGFSSYEAFEMTINELPQYFPEMLQLSAECRFRGCLHIKEPSCAVKKAVTDGRIMNSRYENYLMFHDLIANQKPKYNKEK